MNRVYVPNSMLFLSPVVCGTLNWLHVFEHNIRTQYYIHVCAHIHWLMFNELLRPGRLSKGFQIQTHIFFLITYMYGDLVLNPKWPFIYYWYVCCLAPQQERSWTPCGRPPSPPPTHHPHMINRGAVHRAHSYHQEGKLLLPSVASISPTKYYTIYNPWQVLKYACLRSPPIYVYSNKQRPPTCTHMCVSNYLLHVWI